MTAYRGYQIEAEGLGYVWEDERGVLRYEEPVILETYPTVEAAQAAIDAHLAARPPDHLAQLRAMLQFERSLVDRVGPPGCAARETAVRNVAALEWVLLQYTGVSNHPVTITRPAGSPDAWDRSRPRATLDDRIVDALRRHRELIDAEIESVSATIRQYSARQP